MATIPQADLGPAAAAHQIQEVTEQEDEERWTDDSKSAWWPGLHKYREATPCDAPLLSENKQFICGITYPSALEEQGGVHCPRLRERLKLGDHAVEILSHCSALQQSWLLAN